MTLTEQINETWKTKRELVGWLDYTDLDVLVEQGIPRRIGNSRKEELVAELVTQADSEKYGERVRRELRWRGVE